MKGRRWTDIELQVLRRVYPDSTNQDIADALGRDKKAICLKARSLGLRKSPEFFAAGAGGRFQSGQTPWNKGLKGWDNPQSAATQFKPGRPPHLARNYRPIGSLRITDDGILERKVTDDPSLVPARRWVAVHRLVWEAAHGPIPAGHAVVFRPGLRTTQEADITPDRLELVTRSELMRRNSVHNLPKEVVEVVQLRGRIVAKLNRLEKRHERHQHD